MNSSCLPFAVLLLSLLLPLQPAFAASPALSDAGLQDSVQSVFGASRLPVAAGGARVPGAAYVLTAAELASSGAKTLPDVLRLLPGVVLYDQSGSEYQPVLDLRGFNATPVP